MTHLGGRVRKRVRKAVHTLLDRDLRHALRLPRVSVDKGPAEVDALRAALEWLCWLQDADRSGGVPAGVNLLTWQETGRLAAAVADPYPETSGYILATFLRAGEFQPELRQRARRMADWLVSVQYPEGGFPGRHYGREHHPPVVFNTGQIILGLVAAAEAFGVGAYLEAALRGGRWLVSVQDRDGAFSRHAFSGPHPIQARVAWGLLRCGLVADEEELVAAGQRSLAWVLAQRGEGGWLDRWGLEGRDVALTHHISYAFRGLLEGALLLREVDSEQAQALLTYLAEVLPAYVGAVDEAGFLAGWLGPGFAPAAGFACLTGSAQLAALLCRAHSSGLRGATALLPAARRLTGFVRSTQVWRPGCPAIHGAVAGSYPVNGAYQGLQLVNWAAKFLADSILLAKGGTVLA